MKVLWQYTKGYRLKAFLGPMFKLLEAFMELLMPIFMATLINNLYDIPTVIAGIQITLSSQTCMIIMGCTIVIGYILALLCQYFASVASMGFGERVRSALFDHVLKLSGKEIDSLGTSTIINRVTSDVNQLQHGMAMLIRLITRLPVLAVGACIMVALVNKNMSIIFTIIFPVVMAILIVVMCKVIPMYKVVQGKLDGVSKITSENVLGARVVRAFNEQEQEYERMEKATQDFYNKSMRVNRLLALMTPFAVLIMNFGIVCILIFGAKQVNVGNLAAGDISAFVTYALWIVLAMTIFANLSPVLTRALSSAGRISEVLSIKSSMDETGQKEWQQQYDYIIDFDNVSFGYISDKPVLQNVDLKIKKGEKIGIIGVTGSGKSSLINLLPRIYDIDEGTLKIAGVDIREMNIDKLREHISLAPQRAELFSGTIRENIDFGRNASEQDIIKALELAMAWEFVEKFDNGLDYVLYKGGKNLSGGQKQRLTIARALLQKADVYLFDDCFSALDFATESKLKKALNCLSDKTIITVTQRVSSIQGCDRIVVMKEGKIIGIGKHEELYNTLQEYTLICNSQLRRTK